MNKKQILVYSILLTTLTIKQTSCWFFDEMDKHFQQMENRMKNMRKTFRQMEEDFHSNNIKQSKNGNININQKDNNIVISIDLGKNITNFDAKIKTKQTGHSKDQIIIKTEQPKQQNIVITVIDNYLSINKKTQITHENKQNACTCNTCNACKKPNIQRYSSAISQSSSTVGQTFDKKLDIQKAEIEYDTHTGNLTIVIPKDTAEKVNGKTIAVKIKSPIKKTSTEQTKIDGK